MANSTFNAKIEPTLRAALDAPNSEWNTSGDLLTGFDPETRLWELILFYSGDASALQETFPDYRFIFLLANYAIVSLPEKAIDALAASPLVIYIERPRRFFFEVLAAKRASCITALQPSITESTNHSNLNSTIRDVPDALNLTAPIRELPDTSSSLTNLSGQGTLLSVIDSGIDYTHPDFRNPDGTTRIAALWDQTIAPDPSMGFFSPRGYPLGTLFTEEQINEALTASDTAARLRICPSIDTSGHGTHVTGIAAGNGRASN